MKNHANITSISFVGTVYHPDVCKNNAQYMRSRQVVSRSLLLIQVFALCNQKLLPVEGIGMRVFPMLIPLSAVFSFPRAKRAHDERQRCPWLPLFLSNPDKSSSDIAQYKRAWYFPRWNITVGTRNRSPAAFTKACQSPLMNVLSTESKAG